MTDSLKVVIAQQNFVVGDIEGNSRLIIESAKHARFHLGADVVVFPELAITGYPPEDLLFRQNFIDDVDTALERIRQSVKDIAVIVGFPERDQGEMYNAAAVLYDGELLSVCRKRQLPNYGVFDEKRYFKPGNTPCVVSLHGIPMGVTVCEDIWHEQPAGQLAAAGVKLIININASPYHMEKSQQRFDIVAQRARQSGLPIVYCNLVGGQDELVFDGDSFVMDAQGEVVHRMPACKEGLFLTEFAALDGAYVPVTREINKPRSELQVIYETLVLGVHDYVGKNGFSGVLIGLSGGIDSGLTLAIAVDALGADKVAAVMMPSRYTSTMSLEDAREEAENLEVAYQEISIEPAFEAMLHSLAENFKDTAKDSTEENIQARCRGMILMALSNKTGKLVLTTGNKSELAVGYATLYGDMAGGFNALKDVPKTLVYKLAEYRNTLSVVIPQRVIHRAPSAELAPNQKDSDSLPDYGELDGILELYVEEDMSAQDIVERGFERGVVDQVIRMVNLNEYKRRQAAPGVKITPRAFSRDRRYPITSKYKNY